MEYNLQKYWIAMLYTWNENNTVNNLYFKKNFLKGEKRYANNKFKSQSDWRWKTYYLNFEFDKLNT